MKMAKRMSYTTGFKLKVVELAIKNGNRSAGRKYGVNEKLVHDWRKRKTELEKLYTSSSPIATARSKGTLARTGKQAL